MDGLKLLYFTIYFQHKRRGLPKVFPLKLIEAELLILFADILLANLPKNRHRVRNRNFKAISIYLLLFKLKKLHGETTFGHKEGILRLSDAA